LYLNDDWGEHDGGELLIYPQRGDSPPERIMPGNGVLLVFLSERVVHEVLPARRDRFSIAGWFRVNGSLSERVDPAR
jgi:SM-20-related protein